MPANNKQKFYSEDRLVASAPSENDWSVLYQQWKPSENPEVDIIVPVYKGFEETSRCLYSVLTQKQKTPFRLVVINDCSPDPNINSILEELGQRNLIELHTNKENLGFVRTCNYAMALHPDRDILLLNSDTEVHNNWLDRLVSLMRKLPNAGTATPFSNNAVICNYPYFCEEFAGTFECGDSRLDQLCKINNKGKYVVIPTGVGFCMYVKRECLNKVGYFDYERFGLGYGEENDLCRRIAKAGWDNLLAADVFVRHYGATSFGALKLKQTENALKQVNLLHPEYNQIVMNFVQQDPVKPLRYAIDLARISEFKDTKSVLLVTHNLGGGTIRHINELTEALKDRGVLVCFGFSAPGKPDELAITCPQLGIGKNIAPINVIYNLQQFIEMLQKSSLDHIHIHSLVNLNNLALDFFSDLVERTKIDLDLTIHDYALLCPTINLIDDGNSYCGEPDIAQCELCLKQMNVQTGYPPMWLWRRRYHQLLQHARVIYVPNVDVKNRILRYWKDLNQIVVIPHEVMTTRLKPKQPKYIRHLTTRIIHNIGIIGVMSPHKGSNLIEKCAEYALLNDLPIKFIIFGYTYKNSGLNQFKNIKITGAYQDDQLTRTLVNQDLDFLWFSSICPETYSYTLTKAFESGITPVCFDFGAMAERIKEMKVGETISTTEMLDIAKLTEHLLKLAIKYHHVRNNRFLFKPIRFQF